MKNLFHYIMNSDVYKVLFYLLQKKECESITRMIKDLNISNIGHIYIRELKKYGLVEAKERKRLTNIERKKGLKITDNGIKVARWILSIYKLSRKLEKEVNDGATDSSR